MEIKSIHKGQTVKQVVVANVPGTFPESHGVATNFAMQAVGETPERLLDWDTDEYEDGTVTVTMYTA
jgi:hypothetical protein